MNTSQSTSLMLLLQLMVIVAPSFADAISDDERAAVVAYLEETRDAFVAIVEGLDEDRLHLRVTPERWSIAEIGEHLVKVEGVVYTAMTGPLLESTARSTWQNDGAPLIRDHVIRMAVTNRDARKFTAPEFVAPGSERRTGAETIEAFAAARGKTIELAKTTKADLRLHFLPNPALGMIDGYQWLLFVAAHSERHTIQAREVMAHASFKGKSARLTPEERAFLVDDLHRTEERLRQLVLGLSEEQLRFRPADDRWSIADVIEHLAKAEKALLGLVESAVSDTEARPDLKNPDGTSRVKDLVYTMAITNREAKRFEAPKGIRPFGEFESAEKAMEVFRERRAATVDYVLTTQADLRAHFRENPGFGQMDAFQWLVLLSGHTDRHAQQIEEIKSASGFSQ